VWFEVYRVHNPLFRDFLKEGFYLIHRNPYNRLRAGEHIVRGQMLCYFIVMLRTLIADLPQNVGKTVLIAGWVDVRRDHGKIIFCDIRDRTGTVQSVFLPQQGDALSIAKDLRSEWVVRLEGVVNERPEKMRVPGPLGSIELEVTAIEVLARAAELPFEKDTPVNLETLLNHLPLTLRSKRLRAVFTAQARIIQAFRDTLNKQGFTEFQSPALVGGDAEGGAAVFPVEYYYGKKAYLASSPQLYKQILVGSLERVFSTPKVFRAEKSATTRHLSEYSSLDLEMGFINDHTDVMAVVESVARAMATSVPKEVFLSLEASQPLLPSDSFPTIKLAEAHDLLFQETGVDKRAEPDLDPEDERWLCAWAARERGSDFLFVTHYPVQKRPFYVYEDESDPGFTKSFDLLFRGLEVSTGGQRIHNPFLLEEKIQARGLDPKNFSFYLQAFRYGMPPHGGAAIGLERFTARLLNIPNVKEAAIFPRDMNRIDTLLHDTNSEEF